MTQTDDTVANLGTINSAWEFDISRATEAAVLHDYAREIQADKDLTDVEKAELARKIALRFSALNLAAAGTPKPRWS